MILGLAKSASGTTEQQQMVLNKLHPFKEAIALYFSDLLPEVTIEEEEEELKETDENEWDGEGDWDDNVDPEYEEWEDNEVDWDKEEWEDVEWEDVEWEDEEADYSTFLS
jgi:hypothetical protein